jgi:hypothetical protein
MLDIIKKYQHNEHVITVVETTDFNYAASVWNGTYEEFRVLNNTVALGGSHFYIVSSGGADKEFADDVTVYSSKQAALNAAKDEYCLWRQWDTPVEEIDVDFGTALA